jgi:hypothetical protein
VRWEPRAPLAPRLQRKRSARHASRERSPTRRRPRAACPVPLARSRPRARACAPRAWLARTLGAILASPVPLAHSRASARRAAHRAPLEVAARLARQSAHCARRGLLPPPRQPRAHNARAAPPASQRRQRAPLHRPRVPQARTPRGRSASSACRGNTRPWARRSASDSRAAQVLTAASLERPRRPPFVVPLATSLLLGHRPAMRALQGHLKTVVSRVPHAPRGTHARRRPRETTCTC